MKALETADIFATFPSLSYNNEPSSEEDSVALTEEMTKEGVTSSIKEFRHQFTWLKQKWTSAFQHIEVSHILDRGHGKVVRLQQPAFS